MGLLIAGEHKESKSPDWQWLNKLLIGIVGALLLVILAGVGWWMTEVWSNIARMADSMSSIQMDVSHLKDTVPAQIAAIEQAESARDKRLELLEQMWSPQFHDILQQDDNLLKNWVHPDHGGQR